MELVRQKDWSGCGIAAIAMLTDRDYFAARDRVEETLGCRGRNWATMGLSIDEALAVLESSGWSLESRWGPDEINPLVIWPPAPWAPRHLGYSHKHFIAIEADGNVLDTHWRGKLSSKLADWPELEVVVGLRYTV